MILKEKNNDIALRSLSEIFDEILTKTQAGNFGLLFSSSFTINLHVKLTFGEKLTDVFKSFPDTTGMLFLLPPPARFGGNYRAKHAKSALELLEAGVLVWFDRFVHSKFLLFWSFNHMHFVDHCRYYGSTNFTKGGLIDNIEEFYYNKSGWRCAVDPPKSHIFYLDTAFKRVDEIVKLYESPEYWSEILGNLQNKIPEIIGDLKQKASATKDLIEKLRVSILSYSYMLDMLSELWNLPGKKFAYNMCEKLLAVDDFSSFNLEFLEEVITWPDEILIKFIKRWKIDVNRYFEIPNKVTKSMLILGEDIEEYRKRGYEAYIYREEKGLIEQLKNKQTREALSILRKLLKKYAYSAD